jgi:hypothetical protein
VGLCAAFIFLDNADLSLASEPRDAELTLKREGRIFLYARALAAALLLSARWVLNYAEKGGKQKDSPGCVGLGLASSNFYELGSSVSVDGDAPVDTMQAKYHRSNSRADERDKDRDKRAVLPLILSLVRLLVCVAYSVGYKLVQSAIDVLVTSESPSDLNIFGCLVSMTTPTTPANTTSGNYTVGNATYDTYTSSFPTATVTDVSNATMTTLSALNNVTGVHAKVVDTTPLCSLPLESSLSLWAHYGSCLVQVTFFLLVIMLFMKQNMKRNTILVPEYNQ